MEFGGVNGGERTSSLVIPPCGIPKRNTFPPKALAWAEASPTIAVVDAHGWEEDDDRWRPRNDPVELVRRPLPTGNIIGKSKCSGGTANSYDSFASPEAVSTGESWKRWEWTKAEAEDPLGEEADVGIAAGKNDIDVAKGEATTFFQSHDDEEVDDVEVFFRENHIDDATRAAFRELRPELQQSIMRTDFRESSNASAALLARIARELQSLAASRPPSGLLPLCGIPPMACGGALGIPYPAYAPPPPPLQNPLRGPLQNPLQNPLQIPLQNPLQNSLQSPLQMGMPPPPPPPLRALPWSPTAPAGNPPPPPPVFPMPLAPALDLSASPARDIGSGGVETAGGGLSGLSKACSALKGCGSHQADAQPPMTPEDMESLENFVRRYRVDSRAEAAMRDLPAAARRWLLRSDFTHRRNASASVMALIKRRAWEDAIPTYDDFGPGVVGRASEHPSSEELEALAAAERELEDFVRRHNIDPVAGNAVRSLPLPLRRQVYDADLRNPQNTSAVVVAITKRLKSAAAGQQLPLPPPPGSGNSQRPPPPRPPLEGRQADGEDGDDERSEASRKRQRLAPPLPPPPPVLPPLAAPRPATSAGAPSLRPRAEDPEVEAYLRRHGAQADARQALLDLPAECRRQVMELDFSYSSSPSSALLARIYRVRARGGSSAPRAAFANAAPANAASPAAVAPAATTAMGVAAVACAKQAAAQQPGVAAGKANSKQDSGHPQDRDPEEWSDDPMEGHGAKSAQIATGPALAPGTRMVPQGTPCAIATRANAAAVAAASAVESPAARLAEALAMCPSARSALFILVRWRAPSTADSRGADGVPDVIPIAPGCKFMVLGRSKSCDVPLAVLQLSKAHLQLHLQEGPAGGRSMLLLVEDLSSNGTWLNGQRLMPKRLTQAHQGDRISLLPPSNSAKDVQPLAYDVFEGGSSMRLPPPPPPMPPSVGNGVGPCQAQAPQSQHRPSRTPEQEELIRWRWSWDPDNQLRRHDDLLTSAFDSLQQLREFCSPPNSIDDFFAEVHIENPQHRKGYFAAITRLLQSAPSVATAAMESRTVTKEEEYEPVEHEAMGAVRPADPEDDYEERMSEITDDAYRGYPYEADDRHSQDE